MLLNKINELVKIWSNNSNIYSSTISKKNQTQINTCVSAEHNIYSSVWFAASCSSEFSLSSIKKQTDSLDQLCSVCSLHETPLSASLPQSFFPPDLTNTAGPPDPGCSFCSEFFCWLWFCRAAVLKLPQRNVTSHRSCDRRYCTRWELTETSAKSLLVDWYLFTVKGGYKNIFGNFSVCCAKICSIKANLKIEF